MASQQDRRRPQDVPVVIRPVWWMCGRAMWLCWRVGAGVLVIGLMAAGLFYLRLAQGPIHLPQIASLLLDRLNSQIEGTEVSLDDMVLTLGEGELPAGFEFRGVSVVSAQGQPLFTAPRLSAKLKIGDLLLGKVRPVDLVLAEPRAQLIRSKSGLLRFGLGAGQGIGLEEADADSDAMPGGPGEAAAAKVVAALVGDEPRPAGLEALRLVQIIGADLTYDDRQTGEVWRVRDADLSLRAFDGGARGALSIDVLDSETPGSALRISASRTAGDKATEIVASFGNLHADYLAGQSEMLDWLNVLDGSVEGQVRFALADDGTVDTLEGVFLTEDGSIERIGRPLPYRSISLAFGIDPERERMRIESLVVDAPSVQARLAGLADLSRDEDGDVAGVAGQVDVSSLWLFLPDIFSQQLVFDGGQITGRWRRDEDRIEVANSWLSRDEMSFNLQGRAFERASGWTTDLHAAIRGFTVDDLIAHWPMAAATNARAWVANNISEADLPSVQAEMRIGPGEPQLSVDFTYSDLVSTYLNDMSPIQGAVGRGHLGYHELHLEMDQGYVEPVEGQRVALDGSQVTISDLWGSTTPADIQVHGKGPLSAILRLIDEQPLGLVGKLGLDPAVVVGEADVTTRLKFPLLNDLLIEDINVQADAALTEVRMPLALGKGGTRQIVSDRLSLSATVEEMRIAGEVTAEGVPIAVDWIERYGGAAGGRRISIQGEVNQALLQRFEADDFGIEGSAAVDLVAEQSGNGPIDFTIDADLAKAAFGIDGLDWRKRAGAPGRLKAAGGIGEGTEIRSLDLTADGFELSGAVNLDRNGDVTDARIARLVLPGRVDLAAVVKRPPDAPLEVDVTGRYLDISDKLTAAGGAGEDAPDASAEEKLPIIVRFDVAEVRLTETVNLNDVKGRLDREASGAAGVTFDGALGPGADVSVDLIRRVGAPGALNISSGNAGAVLAAAGLYDGADGGTLKIDAKLIESKSTSLSGTLKIKDMTVRSESTFQQVLREGGLNDAQERVTGNGLTFGRIDVPFIYTDGRIQLNDAVATSPALGLKVHGEVNTDAENLELFGVISPAYGVTGALANVPLLGDILSGGEGEGILAMTFSMDGPLDDPDFSVNPLSILAPGILRNVFERKARPAGKTQLGPELQDKR